jgi:hypothetical protein
MRFTQQEKYEIIQIVEGSEIGVNRTLKELGIHKRTFYNWYGKYKADGYNGLASKARTSESQWNRIPNEIRNDLVDFALEHPELSSRELAFKYIRCRLNHPQTQGKIERYHRSMKNVVKLENYYYPGDLIERLEDFVNFYNNHRYHESLNNMTPSDIYFGRENEVLERRQKIKEQTIKKRRKNHLTNQLNL